MQYNTPYISMGTNGMEWNCRGIEHLLPGSTAAGTPNDWLIVGEHSNKYVATH